jgi:predicted nucleotidyltransferase
MNVHLGDKVIKEVQLIADKYPIKKIILFGSRARGDHSYTSDIDIAVCNFPHFNNRGKFVSEIEDLDTLLKIDIVFFDEISNKKLISNIKEEGVIIYERL